jgi:peptidoglycan/LPS O-acetylase OafA/YrhL
MNAIAVGNNSPVVDPADTSGERDRLGSIALDQWRGLALILVLVSHGFYLTGRVHGIGRVGVNLFFFISGILVYRSLSRARATTARDRTRSFWWRRFRRLYPAMIAYTITMLGGTLLLQNRPDLPPFSDAVSYLKSMPLAFGYVINYFTGTSPMSLRHLWSLACEMQFYLLAPLIFWFGTSGPKRSRSFWILLVVLMALGLAQPFIGKWHPNYWQYNFEFAVWPMMLGFVCEYRREWFKKIPELFVTVILWLSFVIGCVSGCLMLFGYEMKLLVIAAGALLLAPCLLAYLFGRPVPGIAGKCLRWFGERTYSIYLWQQPFTISHFLPAPWHPFGALAAVGVGTLWFRIFEFPFLSAGRQKQEKSR